VRLANDTAFGSSRFGLSRAVFTSDDERGVHFATKIVAA
jgi:hypothetical protein